MVLVYDYFGETATARKIFNRKELTPEVELEIATLTKDGAVDLFMGYVLGSSVAESIRE